MVIATVLGIASHTWADSDDSPTTAASPIFTPPAPDKSQYTLFNPTPDNLLREMSTDRPDKTDEATTIDAGHLQIETGVIDYEYDRDKSNGDNDLDEQFGVGEVEFRLGALNYLEFDVEIDSYEFLRQTDYNEGTSFRQQGFGDVTVGEKLNFWGNENTDVYGETAFGLDAELKCPTADRFIGNEYPEAFFGFPFEMNLPAGFECGAETIIGWQRNSTNTDYTTGWQNMIELDHDIIGKFNVFAEFWSEATMEGGQQTQMTADFGFTFPVARNIILDAGVDIGLNHASESLEATSGFTVRF
jgi:Putative MetA-pathway of phenol degradation